MSFDLIIRGGYVATREQVADIAISEGKFVEIAPEVSGQAKNEIDARGLHVFPGMIDPHVHFNEPGRTDWEGFATGTAALSAGGGTCFFDMPLNSSPPTLDGESFDLKREAAEASSVTDFGLWGGLTPGNLDHMEELAERGVVGFKAFMCPSGIEDFQYADYETLEKGMRIAAKLGLPVAVHAEDPISLELHRAQVKGQTWRDYLDSRPIVCEGRAIGIAAACAEMTGCSVHIVHVSSYFGVADVDYARRRGVRITCETCPHYLILTEDDLIEIGARAKCSPPLRSREWQDMMWEQLNNGSIDFVGSDHSPAPESMKQGDDAFKIWGGIAGVQSTLPILLSPLSHLLPRRVAELTAGNVAKRFKIPSKGLIETGYDADLALVDIGAEYQLQREDLLDRHKLSPYVGRTFKARIARTLVRGREVFRDGKIISKPQGQFVRPTHA